MVAGKRLRSSALTAQVRRRYCGPWRPCRARRAAASGRSASTPGARGRRCGRDLVSSPTSRTFILNCPAPRISSSSRRCLALADPQARAVAALERVGLDQRSGDRAATLYRGLLQRLNLARAVLHEPAVLVLDEPDTGLDAAGREVLSEIVRSQIAGGGSVVLTTHALDYALDLATRVVVLADGRVVLDDARERLAADDRGAGDWRRTLMAGR